jgi:hypothetical protein
MLLKATSTENKLSDMVYDLILSLVVTNPIDTSVAKRVIIFYINDDESLSILDNHFHITPEEYEELRRGTLNAVGCGIWNIGTMEKIVNECSDMWFKLFYDKRAYFQRIKGVEEKQPTLRYTNRTNIIGRQVSILPKVVSEKDGEFTNEMIERVVIKIKKQFPACNNTDFIIV